MTEIEKKTGMTDAECEYWEDYYTNNTFEPGPDLLKQGVKPGFAHTTQLLSQLDQDVAAYLLTGGPGGGQSGNAGLPRSFAKGKTPPGLGVLGKAQNPIVVPLRGTTPAGALRG